MLTIDKSKKIMYPLIVVQNNGLIRIGGISLEFEIGQRYKVYNAVSENHGKFLTLIATNNDLVYYIYDGEDLIQCFSIRSIFVVDLIKLV